MWTMLRGGRAAITFLTRVPVGGFPYSAAEWRWCSGWLPAVGAMVGAVCAAACHLTNAAGAWVAAIVAIAAGLLVTGAFHEDGLADTADALGGAYDRERLFAILKDSRVGAFGAAALAVALLLRAALLARLDGAAPAMLIFVGALSRLPPVWLMASLPYVTPAEDARSKPVALARRAQVVLATCTSIVIAAVAWKVGAVSPRELVNVTVATMVTPVICGWRFVVRAGGVTGDFLGATQQVGECALLLAVALARGASS
jgi:adenosylcobinamide-GDP ribazoletransferase